MYLEEQFSLCNGVAFISWILLIVFPFSKRLKIALTSILITGLAFLYSTLVFKGFDMNTFENFNTLAGISNLFNDPSAVLAGWIHYLAFDLMIGLYITKNAEKYGINRWILIPILLFTFMLGPVGLLLYFLTRVFHTKRYFHSY